MGTRKSAGRLYRPVIRYLFLLLISSLFANQLMAQQRKITVGGLVTDMKGEPVIGANVIVKETKTGTMTDVNGKFSLEATPGAHLEITYIGYTTRRIKLKGQASLNIKMKEDAQLLSDVVVIGYGVQKKESLTGAVGSLKINEIAKTKSTSLAQSIQGKVPGLRIRQPNGEPGAFNSNIDIRGFGTPLFIVDGVVRDGASEFQRLNPVDIESISFLKDATAAIYGMNSANGAIIVTTKKGTVRKPTITLDANLGISSPTDVPDMANAAQYMTMRNEAEINAGRSPYLTQDELQKWTSGAPGYESVDYYDAVMNDYATQYQTNLSIEGGSDKLTYFGSLGYARDNSILKNDVLGYDKYSFRSNVHLNITDYLTADMRVGGRYDSTNHPYSSFFDIFRNTRIAPPVTTIYANNNPQYYNNFGTQTNPAAMIDKEYTGFTTGRDRYLQSQFAMEYTLPFLKDMKLKGQVAYDYDNRSTKVVRKAYNTYVYDESTGNYTAIKANDPSLTQDMRREANRLDMQFQASYNKSINEKHNISAMYVFERREEKTDSINGERKYDFYTESDLNSGRTSDQLAGGGHKREAYLSHIGRITYNYEGKYLAEVACRYDGSYRYAPGSRWAFFPSVSVGWRISEEEFIKNNFPFIDNLKVRGSAGRSGQDAGSPFQYYSGYTLNKGGYVFEQDKYTTGVAAPGLTNRNLTWVKVDMYNIGLDLSLFNGLLALEFDVYQRERSGMLADRYSSLTNTFGATLPQENLNGDRTRGFEFAIAHVNKIGEFNYKAGINFSMARTKNLYTERAPFNSSWDRWRNEAAYRWDDFIWGYGVDGRFEDYDRINAAPIQNGDYGNSKEMPGDYKLTDMNGDGVINDTDRRPMFWSSTPQIHYGLTLQADWKNFDFYALFQGSALYTVQFSDVYALMLCFKGGNTPEYFYDRWHQENPYDPNSQWIAGKWPAIRLEQDMGGLYTRDTEVWRKDASYLRFKTIELGYTFGPKLLKAIGIEKLRVYINGNNLLTFCNSFVKPFDPERIEGSANAGLDYPINKTYNFGFTMTF